MYQHPLGLVTEPEDLVVINPLPGNCECWLNSLFHREGFLMNRFKCLALIATVANVFSSNAQDKKDPPKKDPAKEFTNSVGMKFVWIAPGSFVMGSPKEEK